MTTTQIVGLCLGAFVLAGLVFAYLTAAAMLRDGREKRRYRALVDEDAAREVALRAERIDLEVEVAVSGLDGELKDLLS